MPDLLVRFLLLGLLLCSQAGLQARERNLVRFGKDIVVEADETLKDVVTIGGDIRIHGRVDGDAVAIGGSIRLSPGAVVDGDVVTVGGEIQAAEDARIRGDWVEIGDFNFLSFFSPFRESRWAQPWVFRWVPLVGLLALGIILVLLLPDQLTAVIKEMEKDVLKAVLYGLLAGALFIPLVIFMAISVLGIPLIPLLILCAVAFLLFGYLAVAAVLGKRVLAAFNQPERSLLVQAVLGLLLLALVGWIPFLGWLIKGLIYLIGWGAVILALTEHRRARRVPAPAFVPAEKISSD